MLWFPCCDVRYDFRIKTVFVSSLPPVVCMMSHVLFRVFVSSLPPVVCMMSHVLFRVFVSSLPPVVCMMSHVLFTLFVFVCAEWCPTHIALCFCFVFLRLIYVASFSGLSIFYYPFGILYRLILHFSRQGRIQHLVVFFITSNMSET